MKRKILLIILLVLASSICSSQEKSKDLDTKKMMERLSQISEDAEVWAAKQRTIARERYQQCFDAFGHEDFCSCINEELHWVLGFHSYIRIITAPSIGATSDASPDERAVIESVYKAREKCVSKYFGERK